MTYLIIVEDHRGEVFYDEHFIGNDTEAVIAARELARLYRRKTICLSADHRNVWQSDFDA